MAAVAFAAMAALLLLLDAERAARATYTIHGRASEARGGKGMLSAFQCCEPVTTTS